MSSDGQSSKTAEFLSIHIIVFAVLISLFIHWCNHASHCSYGVATFMASPGCSSALGEIPVSAPLPPTSRNQILSIILKTIQ